MEMTSLPKTDLRLYLQQSLIERCRKNPAYSLRAFAKKLAIEPSALSKILRGKRAITTEMFQHLCKGLELTPGEAEKMNPAANLKDDYRELSLDHFQVMADWYHFAILELTQVKHFRPDPRWIAKTLSMGVMEVNAAVERLLRLEMLEIRQERGKEKWIDRSGSVTTVGNEFSAIAFRRLQKQVLEMGVHALENTPYELRDQSSMTMAIDTRKLPEAKKRLKRFRRSLCHFLQQDGKPDAVYQLGLSFYPLTIPSTKKDTA